VDIVVGVDMMSKAKVSEEAGERLDGQTRDLEELERVTVSALG
jgi:hypothetical protein